MYPHCSNQNFCCLFYLNYLNVWEWFCLFKSQCVTLCTSDIDWSLTIKHSDSSKLHIPAISSQVFPNEDVLLTSALLPHSLICLCVCHFLFSRALDSDGRIIFQHAPYFSLRVNHGSDGRQAGRHGSENVFVPSPSRNRRARLVASVVKKEWHPSSNRWGWWLILHNWWACRATVFVFILNLTLTLWLRSFPSNLLCEAY